MCIEVIIPDKYIHEKCRSVLSRRIFKRLTKIQHLYHTTKKKPSSKPWNLFDTKFETMLVNRYTSEVLQNKLICIVWKYSSKHLRLADMQRNNHKPKTFVIC